MYINWHLPNRIVYEKLITLHLSYYIITHNCVHHVKQRFKNGNKENNITDVSAIEGKV